MPRIHIFELEDQPWLPRTLRDLATDYLAFLLSWLEPYRQIVPFLSQALITTGRQRLIDLCSGGAGPVLDLQRALAREGLDVTVTLTDKYPNLPAFARLRRGDDAVDFWPAPVDATAVPAELAGFRTIFTAFHHFRPEEAKKILADAVRARSPIGVFDVAERSPRMLLFALLCVPLLVFALTPFIRPVRWQRLLWTYVLPLVPLICWWDGVVSQLRAYRPDELEAMVDELPSNGFHWRIGATRSAFYRGCVTFLIGYPRSPVDPT